MVESKCFSNFSKVAIKYTRSHLTPVQCWTVLKACVSIPSLIKLPNNIAWWERERNIIMLLDVEQIVTCCSLGTILKSKGQIDFID